MARNTTLIRSRPEKVFQILLDPAAYPLWVVGTRRLESVEPEWPAPGSAFWVQFVGATKTEKTEVIEVERPVRIVLQPHVRPLGVTHVIIELEPRGARTVVSLTEELWPPSRSRIIRRIADMALFLRNIEALRRFRRVVESPSAA